MSAAPRTRTRLFSAAKFTLGLALLILLVRWLAPDLSAVLRDIHLDLAALALAVLTHAVATAAVSLRWKLMVEAMGGTPLPYIIYFRAFALTKLVGNVTSSLAMDLIGRGVALRSAGSEQGLGLAMTQAVLERIFDVVLPLAMVAWALAVHHLQPSDAAAAASFLLIGLAIGGLSALVLWPLTRVALRLYFWARAWRRPGALAAPAPATPPISRGSPRRSACSASSATSPCSPATSRSRGPSAPPSPPRRSPPPCRSASSPRSSASPRAPSASKRPAGPARCASWGHRRRRDRPLCRRRPPPQRPLLPLPLPRHLAARARASGRRRPASGSPLRPASTPRRRS
ncbi:MAG: flippase-like domain-containing protein [Nannocystis sp.]|nr:flippase-like domain-containing protein [Nannocystis sp.]